MQFKDYLLHEATNKAEITELKDRMHKYQMHYEASDRHTPDETAEYKERMSKMKAELSKLQGNKSTGTNSNDTREKQNADSNYRRAKDFISKNTPKLKELESDKDHQEKLKTGFKRGSWQVAILKGEMKKAQDFIDKYENEK